MKHKECGGCSKNFHAGAVTHYAKQMYLARSRQVLLGSGASGLPTLWRWEVQGTLHASQVHALTDGATCLGLRAGRPRGEVARAVAAARMRAKDPDAARTAEADIVEAAEYVATAALAATAALLHVRSPLRVPCRAKLHATGPDATDTSLFTPL